MISDFDGQFFWPAVKTMVTTAGVEPISQGEPEDEIWRKIFAAMAALGNPLSLGMSPGELLKAAYAQAQSGGDPSLAFAFTFNGEMFTYGGAAITYGAP